VDILVIDCLILFYYCRGSGRKPSCLIGEMFWDAGRQGCDICGLAGGQENNAQLFSLVHLIERLHRWRPCFLHCPLSGCVVSVVISPFLAIREGVKVSRKREGALGEPHLLRLPPPEWPYVCACRTGDSQSLGEKKVRLLRMAKVQLRSTGNPSSNALTKSHPSGAFLSGRLLFSSFCFLLIAG
jgi:hypothetical protein